MENNIFELNYANSEYCDRHSNSESKPKQTPLEWHNWDDLIEFFEKYFQYFGDDILTLDKDIFKKIVKTIWRISNVEGYFRGREDMKNEIPSFTKQLQDWFKDIQRHNEAEREDIITPTDIWQEVLHMKIN